MATHWSRAILSLLLPLYFLALPARADVQWPQLKYTQIASSLLSPVQVTHAADGSNRLFIVSKWGRVLIYQGGQLLTTPFLDISSRVFAEFAETGLLSIAFPPGYASKQYFYVTYTRTSDHAVVLSRFSAPTATPNVANAASEQVLLVVPHPNDIHFGGQLAFGPDGYLYIGLGDGGPEGDTSDNAQNTSLLLGKILRIDTENAASPYAIPPTNPFVGVTGYQPEIWAVGLRNPWRFSFDRQTGDLYIADVGQNAWEEVDFQAAGSPGGQNYGWRIMEGNHPYVVPNGYDTSQLTPPIVEYAHQGNPQYGNAIIGGYVYRGPASRLSGMYLYADFGLGTISGAIRDGGQWVTQTFDTRGQQFSSFGEDESGQLYVASISSGTVYQIEEDTVTRTPTFNRSPGNYTFDITVTATTTTVGATIHYTTNGIDPTESDPVFPAGGVAITGPGITLKARAFHTYYSPSAVAGGAYTFSAATPSFGPNFVVIDPSVGKDITITTTTPNSTIYYTLDGSVPTAASTLYTGSVHLAAGPITVKALALCPNYQPSAVGSGTWGAMRLSSPQIGANGNLQLNNGVLTITGPGEIHYTLDGSTPTQSSPLYTGPVLLTQPGSVTAFSIGTGYNPSFPVSANVTLHNTEATNFAVASGSSTAGFDDSATYTSVMYYRPSAVCVDPKTNAFYVCDSGNHAIRRGTAFGPVTTIAGNGTAGYVNATGSAARFNGPNDLCLDPSGNLYVSDSGNSVIRKVDPVGNVTTYAGSGVSGSVDGPGPRARFAGVGGLAMDAAGNLFVGTAAGKVRKVDPQQNVTTFATLPDLTGTVKVAITPAGRMFACTTISTRVYEISASGAVSIFAGTANSGYTDGPRTVSVFNGIRGIAADSLGALYILENTRVRKIATDGMVSTLVDTPAGLNNPWGLAAGAGGNVFIGGYLLNCIYLASPIPAWPFVIQSVTPNGVGQVVITWPSAVGRNYALYYSDDMQTWTYTGSLYPGTGNAISTTQPMGQNGQRFFKVKAL